MHATAPVEVRPATADDRDLVIALARRLADFRLPEGRHAADVVAAEERTLLAAFAAGRHGEDLWIAALDGTPAGFLFLERHADYFTGEPHGHVSMLAVAQEAEGRGVARALMAQAERWARERGFSALTLNVFHDNSRARSLYERVGYRPDTVRYRKEL